MKLLYFTVCLVVVVSGGRLQKRQDLGEGGYDVDGDFGDAGSGGPGDGLEAILGEQSDIILTRTVQDVEERAVKGNGCTTPQGTQGVCSYIVDPPCKDVLEIIQYAGLTQTIINYLKKAIQSPCGKDALDYTMCCEGTPAVVPQTPAPPVVTQAPTTSAPLTSICGFNEKTRIVNGQESVPGNWPWAVIVGKTKPPTFQVTCGGTLISERYVLTASHCFVGQVSQSTHVRVGEHDISSTTDGVKAEDIPISKVITHPGYTSTELQNDIALLQLSTPVVFRLGLKPACLPEQYVGFDLTKLQSLPVVVGWGATTTGGATVNALREAHIAVIPKATCETAYAPVSRIKITDNQLCAGTGDKDTCTGDSGGPMLSDQFNRYAVIGITSFGVKCADTKFPGVYTRVDKFLDWIKANMQ